MRTVVLGATALNVTELGFGGIPIIPLPHTEAVDIVRYCFDRGIHFFDTANMYADSEKKIGAALADVREQVVLATKTLKRDAVGAAKHVGFSLQNLQTDVIDLYQLHNISEKSELETVLAPGGAYEALSEARAAGRIRYIGFTSHNLDVAVEACRTGLFATVQIPFNFIEDDPAETLFNAAARENMGIIGMKPLGGGMLGRADLCFKFLQQYPGVVPIPGISTRAEIDEILDLYQTPQPLSDQDRQDIAQIRDALGKRFCHRCGYCLPCPQDVKIPEVLMFEPLTRRIAPAGVIQISRDAMASAEKCEDCGECLEKCPYGLPVPELVRENLALFRKFVEQHGGHQR